MKINIVNNTDLEIAVNKSEDGIIILTIDDAKKNEKLLGDVKPGEIVKLGEREYIVLGHDAETTVVITNDTVKDMDFGKTGDYLTSNVRKYCNGEFYNELVAAVGAENIVKHTVKLVADDGTGKGKTCCDNVSIITTENYRRYREFLKADREEWWTATSVAFDEGYLCGVRCVNHDGVLYGENCGFRRGVRPFCILKSSVVVE